MLLFIITWLIGAVVSFSVIVRLDGCTDFDENIVECLKICLIAGPFTLLIVLIVILCESKIKDSMKAKVEQIIEKYMKWINEL